MAPSCAVLTLTRGASWTEGAFGAFGAWRRWGAFTSWGHLRLQRGGDMSRCPPLKYATGHVPLCLQSKPITSPTPPHSSNAPRRRWCSSRRAVPGARRRTASSWCHLSVDAAEEPCSATGRRRCRRSPSSSAWPASRWAASSSWCCSTRRPPVRSDRWSSQTHACQL